jgi:hypothetical protein
MGTSGQLCEGCFPKLSLSTRHVGDTYSDLGATITAPAQDKKPRNQNHLNGKLVSDIVIDTSPLRTRIAV